MPFVARRMMSLSASLALLVVVALVGVVNVASAQEYPLRTGDLETSSGTTIAAGEIFTLTGSGFAPGAEVVVTIESDPVVLGDVVADGAGVISTSVQIPTSLEAGTHTLKATGTAAGGGVLVLALTVEVAGSDDGGAGDPDGTVGDVDETAAGDELAATGIGLVVPAVIGLSLLTGGGAAIAVARRRRGA